MNKFYYVLSDGYIVVDSELQKSFHITHGHPPSDDSSEFDDWVEELKKTTIKEIVPSEEMSVERLAPIREILAIQFYREYTGCPLHVAKDYVDSLLGKGSKLSEAEMFISKCKFSNPIGDIQKDCLISVPEFIDLTSTKSIIDYDGFGEIIIDGRIVANCILCTEENEVYFDDSTISPRFYPLRKLVGMFGDRVQIAWYNK